MPGSARPRPPHDICRASLSCAGKCGAGAEPGVVGWAEAHLRRAHHLSTPIILNGGHAALCPPYEVHRFLFTGLRFSMNAAMPSERSSSAKVEWNRLRSTFIPSDSGV